MSETDREYINRVMGEVHELANYKVNWALLDALTDFWDTENAVFNLNGNELTPTLEEYSQLVRGTDWVKGIVQPDLQNRSDDATLARLLKVTTSHMTTELRLNGGHGMSVELLICWIEQRIADKSNPLGRCHAFVLLVFGTLLFPFSNGLIDSAMAKVVVQVIEGKSFVPALLAETIASLNHLKTKRKGDLRASPALLQIWLLSHIKEFGVNLVKAGFLGDNKVISRMLGRSLFEAEKWTSLDWKAYILKITHKDILWTARWFAIRRPTILRCKAFEGIPLLSHRISMVTYPSRVIRQFGGFQNIPIDIHENPRNLHHIDPTVSLRDSVRQVNINWANKVLVLLEPPAGPTEEESEYRATSEYIYKFYLAPGNPPFDPEEVIGDRPERPPSSHEDIYEVMKARVEIQSKAWAEEHARSKKEIQRLRLELKCARNDVKARDRALEEREHEAAELSIVIRKCRRKAKQVKRFAKCISRASIRTTEQATNALEELSHRVKRLRE
jgi:hypothetical protein